MQPDHTRIIELLAAQHEQGRTLIVSLLGAGAKWHLIATIAQFYSSLDETTNNLGDRPHGGLQVIQGAAMHVGYSQASVLDLEATMQELSRLEKRLLAAIEEVEARTASLERQASRT
ncbi:hypothetical protein [Stenomitos frigidus]|uniref:Uncharacterized protein n=1 Tax=Stenomitos frigidus ULC18 TaxID=2107698 RepID=A0A2T1DUA9_9CYAN|nr:hypothetical protein [Stenomitos frigidus]PSB24093.1 hypothetical protein C7B82_28555 [Stenomitos frigidus ULC18]